MSAPKPITWFVPMEYKKARADMTRLLSITMWGCIYAVTAAITAPLLVWINHATPNLEVNWWQIIALSVFTMPVCMLAVTLLGFLPAHITINDTSIYSFPENEVIFLKHISFATLQSRNKWLFLRIIHKGKEIEIALGNNVIPGQLIEFLRDRGVRTCRNRPKTIKSPLKKPRKAAA